jgi:hypothetical protein
MSTRKSSVGVARRVAPKPHIPYRADNLDVGKKTGVAVDRVDRKSDGFEPFQAVVELMDNKRSPPRAKSDIRNKNKPVNRVEEEVNDESAQDMTIGEMSMELDDSMRAFHSNILVALKRKEKLPPDLHILILRMIRVQPILALWRLRLLVVSTVLRMSILTKYQVHAPKVPQSGSP